MSDAYKIDGKAFHWIECLEDMNGNDRNPGFCADLWRAEDGEELIALGGMWSYFFKGDAVGLECPDFIRGKAVLALKSSFLSDSMRPALDIIEAHSL